MLLNLARLRLADPALYQNFDPRTDSNYRAPQASIDDKGLGHFNPRLSLVWYRGEHLISLSVLPPSWEGASASRANTTMKGFIRQMLSFQSYLLLPMSGSPVLKVMLHVLLSRLPRCPCPALSNGCLLLCWLSSTKFFFPPVISIYSTTAED
jgi:hypothetical protein